MIEVLFSSASTLFAVLLALTWAKVRFDEMEKRHQRGMELLLLELKRHLALPPGEPEVCTAENCTEKTPEQCAHYGEAADEKPHPLPVARVHKP